MSFASLGLSASILEAIEEQGYNAPSPIQEQSIPVILKGNDLMAAAQTGTGKTAAFTLPILETLSKNGKVRSNHVRALVLTPTRELAIQVGESVQTYGKNLPLRSAVVYGGVKINPQMMALRRGVDVLVATPGRLLDLFDKNAVRFEQIDVLVLDEADRMLDMGFIHDIRKIINLLPKKRQNLLFSATFSDDVRALAKTIVNQPLEVSVTPRNTTATTVEQSIIAVDKSKKNELLSTLIASEELEQVLVFSRTKHGANRLVKKLSGKNISAAAIHGNKSQGARTKALSDFKNGEIRALVATDIAARGLDIDQLPQVINFDLPNVAEDYVHRIGRTGRAGANGRAISFVTIEDIKLLTDIQNLIQEILPCVEYPGFEPTEKFPETTLKKPKPKRPKKNKKKTSVEANSSGTQKQTTDSNRTNQVKKRRRPATKRSRPGERARRQQSS
ncbi:DEAD/DEAH box helicase [Alteromonadaceae bacterium M269]|nr:DEAD/DEAH box helicase [Alteromonadaceae bacterium M269]